MKVLFVLDINYFGDNWLKVAEVTAPCCDRIWFRVKGRSDRETLELAKRLRKIIPSKTLLLSERADIASCAGFEGVHLNMGTPPPLEVKRSFPELIVGYSAHSLQECRVSGADYFTLSPIFRTEKSVGAPIGAVPAPAPYVYALGGINAETAQSLKGLGYEGVAGIRLFSDVEKIKEEIVS